MLGFRIWRFCDVRVYISALYVYEVISTTVAITVVPMMLAVGAAKYFKVICDIYTSNCICNPDKKLFWNSIKTGFHS